MSEYTSKSYNELVVDCPRALLVCPECDLILQNAVQTQEGVMLCEPCFKVIADTTDLISQKTGIAVRGTDGRPFSFPDKAVRKEVQQLQVKCENAQFGCLWIGSLVNYLEEHDDLCESKPIQCRHCDKIVPRKEVEEHHDIHECSVIECSGETVIKREASTVDNQEDILNKLKQSESKCQQQDIQIRNLQTQVHQYAMSESLATTSESNNVDQSRMGRLMEQQTHCQNECNQIERLRDEERVTEGDSNLMYEPSLEQLGNSSETKNNCVDLEPVHGISPQLESQTPTVQTQVQQHALSVCSATTSESFNNVDQSRIGQLEKRYEDMEQQVSLLKVHVSELELQLQNSLASTQDGSFLWRIPDVKRRKRDTIEERITSLYSPPFYTGRNGYKMCIRSYLNGDGIGYQTHLSLFFVVMKGEFDALLKWPFDYKVSLILVDQNHRKHIVQIFKPTPESSSFQRPVSDMNVASGCPKFADLYSSPRRKC